MTNKQPLHPRSGEMCEACDRMIDPDPASEDFDAPFCTWDGEHDKCADCKGWIIGARWNGGLCRECHEDRLLPETAWDRWENEYA